VRRAQARQAAVSAAQGCAQGKRRGPPLDRWGADGRARPPPPWSWSGSVPKPTVESRAPVRHRCTPVEPVRAFCAPVAGAARVVRRAAHAGRARERRHPRGRPPGVGVRVGFFRDDIAARIVSAYVDCGIIARSPFATIDREGVGELLEIAVARGRRARPGLKTGVCGEHGGDPASIGIFHAGGARLCQLLAVPRARRAASLRLRPRSSADGAHASSGEAADSSRRRRTAPSRSTYCPRWRAARNWSRTRS
jgi:PEP-utilising enzyme, PEP-binding domain